MDRTVRPFAPDWQVSLLRAVGRVLRLLLTGLPVLSLLMLPVSTAGAGENAPSGDTSRAVTIVCGPLPFVSDGLACERGIGAELARMACDDAHLSCNFQQYPWPRAQKEVEMGQADILIGPFYTPERATWMVFSREHFYVDQMWLFRLARLDDGILPDKPPQRIGVPLGWAVGGGLEGWRDVTVENVRNVDLALNLLLSGRLDAVAAHARAVARFQEERREARFLPVGPALSTQRSYMGFSRTFAASPQRQAFEAAYEVLLRGPRYVELLVRNKPLPGMRTEVAQRGHQFAPEP